MEPKPLRSFVLAFFCLLLMALLLRFISPSAEGEENNDWLLHGDSYSASQNGFRAFFDLLKRLQVPVDRFTKVPGALGDTWGDPHESLLLLLESRSAESKHKEALEEWVRQGGVVIEANPISGAEINIREKKMGEGSWVTVQPATLFKNKLIGQEDHAWQAYQLITRFGERRVLFDEFFHGYAEAESLFSLAFEKPWVYLSGSLGVFLLALIFSKIFHFGPPQREPVPIRARGEYLNALAGLYKKVSAYSFVMNKLEQGYRKEWGELMDPRWQAQQSSILQEKENILKRGPSLHNVYRWAKRCHQLYKEVRHERGTRGLQSNR